MELVDVAGLEPATPYLQSYPKNSKKLVRLVFTYVVVLGF